VNPRDFVNALCDLDFENVFNPYSSHCSVHDLPNAAKLRKLALLEMLNEASQREIDSLWIGRDLGYRGGRRTGVALTDDVHLNAYASRWGISIKRPTKGLPVGERTAAVIWSVLALIETPVVLWNVFPLHPHESGEPFSNRSHNSCEGKVGEEFLVAMLMMLKPKRIVAIGNDAARVALRIAGSCEVFHIRHPSYGGQTEFLQQVKSLYGISDHGPQAHLL
jgi:hypothetical protein